MLDWLLVLPEELEVAFRRKLTEYEEKQNMPHITSIERLSRQEGRQEGRVEGRVEGRAEGQMEALRTATLEFLEARFGDVPYELREELQTLTDETVLKRLPRLAAVATGLDDFHRQLRKPELGA